MIKKIILLGFLATAFSCQNLEIERNYPENPENIRKQRAGKFFNNDLSFGGNTKTPTENTKISSQKNQSTLWQSSFEVISGMLPILVAEESSGLIVSEWYQSSKNKNSRIKINLLVKGEKPIYENLVVTIFRQTKVENEKWIDQKLGDDSKTSKKIKDKIIEKTQQY